MALERTYTIPLRKEWLKAPRYKRAKKAVTALREFLKRHMKSDDVKIGTRLNLEIWKHGIKNPPGKVKVNVVKDDKNVVTAELYGVAKEKEGGKTKEKSKEKSGSDDAKKVKTESGETPKEETGLKEAEGKEKSEAFKKIQKLKGETKESGSIKNKKENSKKPEKSRKQQ